VEPVVDEAMMWAFLVLALAALVASVLADEGER
jgi:hypothetical protein